MEILILFYLIRFLLVQTTKSDYRPSLDNHYSKSDSKKTKSNTFFPINETHKHFNALQNAKKVTFKKQVNFVFNHLQDLPKILQITDSVKLVKVMDTLSNIEHDALLEQRMVIYLNILIHKNYVANSQKISEQFKFICPMSAQVFDLLNELEDKMILENRIDIVQTITACKAQQINYEK